MIRSGKIAIAVLGAMDPAKKDEESKRLRECTLLLTRKGVVDRVITSLDVIDGGLRIVELNDRINEPEVRDLTKAIIFV